MVIARKLREVLRDLIPLVEPGKVAGFLNDVGGPRKLNGLVEDIREAMMNYQVCSLGPSSLQRLTSFPDFVTARHLQRGLQAHRESRSLSFRPRVVTVW